MVVFEALLCRVFITAGTFEKIHFAMGLEKREK